MSMATFLLTIDFELIYGFIFNGNFRNSSYIDYLSKKRDFVLNKVLKILKCNEIRATWALVGNLMEHQPATPKPPYKSFYEECYNLFPIKKYNNLYNAIDILEKIKYSYVDHEIAFHSFYLYLI